MNPASKFINVSTYRFAPLTDLKRHRANLLELARLRRLKGTILLSEEGINLFVAGLRPDVDAFLEALREIPGLEGLEPKLSESAHQPFNRMLVRIKKEIIAFGVEGINPAFRTSPKLPAQELKRWLDEGRPITLLDTRNDYEVKLGTFRNAIPIGVSHFRDFPQAVAQLPEPLKKQPIVMFCTGGIRCEKAGPYMESQGFEQIFQLEGGILKYFEEVGEAHYDGDCFVFDQRVGVDPSLHETPDAQCFVCLTPLSHSEQQDTRYVVGKSCPYCFRTPAEQSRQAIERRQRKLAEVCQPLPGMMPYDQRRPLKVAAAHDGMTALDFVCTILGHIARDIWVEEFALGRFLHSDGSALAGQEFVRAGDRLFHLLPNQAEPEVNVDIRLLFEDESLLVLEKPAPLPVHPGGRFNRHSLQYFLDLAYAPQRPRPAHRLDANTSGLMVVARTRHVAGLLQPLFAAGKVEKLYLARIQGHPLGNEFSCDVAIASDPSEAGGRAPADDGLEALTEFSVLRRLGDGTSLVQARPVTGRTNQIRVHLWQLGFPVCGDPLYLPGRKMGKVQTLALGAEPLALHSHRLAFHHPVSGEWLEFVSWPEFAQELEGKH